MVKNRNLVNDSILVVQILVFMNEELLLLVKNKTDTVANRTKKYLNKLWNFR